MSLTKCQMVTDHETRIASLESSETATTAASTATAAQATATAAEATAAAAQATAAAARLLAGALWAERDGLDCRRLGGALGSTAGLALPGGADFAVCQADWTAHGAALDATFGTAAWTDAAASLSTGTTCTPLEVRAGEAGQLFSADAVVCAARPSAAIAHAGELRTIRDRVCMPA